MKIAKITFVLLLLSGAFAGGCGQKSADEVAKGAPVPTETQAKIKAAQAQAAQSNMPPQAQAMMMNKQMRR